MFWGFMITSYGYYLRKIPDSVERLFESLSPPAIIQDINDENEDEKRKNPKHLQLYAWQEPPDVITPMYVAGSFIDNFFFHHGTITFTLDNDDDDD